MDVAGVAVGVISLGIEVCKGLLTFYHDWKDCPEDVRDACTSIEKLDKTFVLIQKSVNSPGLSPDVVQRVENCLFSCNEGVKKLQKRLGKIKIEAPQTSKEKFKTTTSRLAYPFKRSVVEKLKETVQELLQYLALAIQILQLNLGISTQVGVDNINEKLDKLMSCEEEKLLEDALDWLSASDPTTNHEEATSKHEEGTGLWFLNSEAYTNWLIGKFDRFWLHGKAGCCKTILSSMIIENLKSQIVEKTNWDLAYFYFSFSDSRKQTYLDLLLSFVTQLSSGRPLHPDLKKAWKSKDRNISTLEGVLVSLIQQTSQTLFVIDALDESPEYSGRERVFLGLQQLSRACGSLKWLITSRNETDIRDFMVTWQVKVMPIDENCVNADINLYVVREVERSLRLKRLSAEVKTEIKDTFLKKADGMFRWAYCQLDEIKKLKLLRPKYVIEALSAMPTTLDQTYERILASLEEYDEVKTALQWLAFSERPLTVLELQEACITTYRSKPYIDIESREAMASLIDIMSTLVQIETHDGDDSTPSDNISLRSENNNVYTRESRMDSYVLLAHFSVKEYIVHDRIRSSSAAHFYLEPDLTHYALAQSCVAYLLHTYGAWDEQVEDYYEKYYGDHKAAYPLLNYAEVFWGNHLYHAESSSDIAEYETSLHFEFLDSDSAKGLWLFSHKFPGIRYGGRENETPLCLASARGLTKTVSHFLTRRLDFLHGEINLDNPLHQACSQGHKDIVEILLGAGANVVCRNSGWGSGTALQYAAHGGYISIAQLLLRHGADINARGGLWDDALCAAIEMTRFEMVEFLLEAGAEVYPGLSGYGTSLCAAARTGSKEIAKLLIRKGAHINMQAGILGYPLTTAAANGHHDFVELLLREGADVNFQGQSLYAGQSMALESAIYSMNASSLKLLLENGADIHLLPESTITIDAACADLLIAYSVKNLSYYYHDLMCTFKFITRLTDANGLPIRPDGKWREDIRKDRPFRIGWSLVHDDNINERVASETTPE